MKPLLVAAAVIEKDGKILIAQRKKGWRFAGKWEFPGGKIEPNETPEECLRRELREELGIETEIGDFFCVSTYRIPSRNGPASCISGVSCLRRVYAARPSGDSMGVAGATRAVRFSRG